MLKWTCHCSGLLRSSCPMMAPRKYRFRRVTNLRLVRVIFCIVCLLICISVTKGLDISSDKDVSASESSSTGPGKSSDRGRVPSKKGQEKRTGTHKLNNKTTLPSDLLLAGERPPKSGPEKETQPGSWRDVLTDKVASRLKSTDSSSKHRKSSAVVGNDEGEEDLMKTWEDDWNEEDLSPYVASPDDSSIDQDDYYTYDYFDDVVTDDDGEGNGELAGDRSKKDTSSSPESRPQRQHPLDRLAELVTGANPQLRLFNLSTPNPDIEITIEVLNEDEVQDDDVVISMDLRDHEKMGAPDGEAPRTPDGKASIEDNSLARPTSPAEDEDIFEEEPDDGKGPDDSADDSYSSLEFIHLLPFPDPDVFVFEPDDPFEDKEGTWSDWTECSASCGGGRSERSRSCGFSCTATESKDCNQQSCPRRDSSDANTGLGAEVPRFPSLDAEYLEAVLDPQNFDTDSCEEWMSCRSETLLSYLSRLQDLPNCPCFYPTNIHRNSAIWDRQKRRMFRWMESSDEEARLDVYKPTAAYCIISMLSPHSTSLAAQQCCYDRNERLITRGPGAGTPQLISAEISPELHYKIDIMPWIICKGDWTKYNKVRHPNNMWECKESPDQAEFYHLYQEAKNF